MSGDVVGKLLALGHSRDADARIEEIEQILTTAAGQPLTAKVARDTFTKMLSRVREGHIQHIGHNTEDMAVMISLRDLATLVSASNNSLSFGSALDEVGFAPIGRRIKVASSALRLPLRRP